MSTTRIFKTRWFVREASSHGISDDGFYQVTQSTLQDKVVDLGGRVYEERLNRNRNRAITLTESAGYWFYTFLYVRQDMANINHRELMSSRGLAKHYASPSEEKTTVLAKNKELVEIYNDSKKQI